jgi:hypothetical protein
MIIGNIIGSIVTGSSSPPAEPLELTYFGSSSNPADNGSAALTIVEWTPPASMVRGDHVIIFVQARAVVTITTNVDGGQIWKSYTKHDVAGQPGALQIYHCEFNGTWAANPRWQLGSGPGSSSVIGHVFRSSVANAIWSDDVTPAQNAAAAATTISITSINTLGDNTLALAVWASPDDNTWGNLSGTGWSVLGDAQYRNLGGSDQSSTYAYKILTAPAATGNVQKDQLTLGPDATMTQIFSLKAVEPESGTVTSSGRRLIADFGDSNAMCAGESDETIAADTLFRSIDGVLAEITTQDVDNDPNPLVTYGGPYKQYALDYKSFTGRKTVLVNRALSGSGVVDWALTSVGNAWLSFVDQVRQARATLNIAEVGEVQCQLLLNDIRSGTATATLIANLTTVLGLYEVEFPNTPLKWVVPGRSASLYTSRHYVMITDLISRAAAKSYLHLVGCGMSAHGSDNMQSDQLHYKQVFNQIVGSMMVRHTHTNSAISNKWIRSVTSSFGEDITSGHKTLVANLLQVFITNNSYLDIEHMSVWKAESLISACVDWSFVSSSYLNAATFTVNGYFQTSGLSDIAVIFNPSYFNTRCSQNDVIFGVYLQEKSTAGDCSLFGLADGTGLGIELRQSGANIQYKVNCSTYSTLAATSIVQGHWYFVARSGGTQYLIMDNAIIHSEAVASTGTANVEMVVGALSTSGTRSNRMAGKFVSAIAAKYSTFPLSDFYTSSIALISGW